MKTPEEMAEEYRENHDECEFARDAFLAGYKAAQPQWISVKERLPEDGEVFLVIMPKGTVTLGGIRKKTQTWDVFLNMAIWTAEPTHWMPLPTPPEENNK